MFGKNIYRNMRIIVNKNGINRKANEERYEEKIEM